MNLPAANGGELTPERLDINHLAVRLELVEGWTANRRIQGDGHLFSIFRIFQSVALSNSVSIVR